MVVTKGEDRKYLNEKDVILRIKEKHPNFEYISGYQGCESRIKLRCLGCGETLERNAQVLRKNKKLSCRNCLIKEKEKIKEEEIKQKELEKQKLIEEKERQRIKELTTNCKECGEVFIGAYKGVKFCSRACASRYHDRVKEVRRRKRLKRNGKIDHSITLPKLIKRDKGICKICGKLVDTKDFIRTKEGHFIAGSRYPSIDHILAVAHGGTHTWSNVQLAHRGCNVEKRDEFILEGEEGQLKLCV